PQSYRKLVSNLYFVYSALEEELTKHRDHEVLKNLFFPELWRKSSLEADLEYYYGADWRSQVTPSPACAKYLQRLQEVSTQDPILLVGHAYTRYMGDLSGGQVLKKIAKQAMGLGDRGTAFYEFEGIRNHGEFKKQYRAAMNNLPLSAEECDRVVAEANHAFHLNMDMFRELEGNWLLALLQLTWNSIVEKLRPTARRPIGSQV
ncbi:MAG: biliverdin-producing heme oxygenase, partial [Cyanobacteria bacterium KgW148]|nr:biliverdin-producing heme oxygenase [Cyanobacteria bacterium KgW148]